LDSAYGFALDANGNIYVVGYTSGDLVRLNGGNNDAIVRKLDAAGNVIWTLQWGGSNYDEASSVLTKGSSQVWVGGILDGDAFCRKIDSDGNEIWTAWWRGSMNDALWDMVLLDDESIIAVGSTESSLGGTGGAFVSRVNAAGDILWTHQFGFKTSDYARGVAFGPDGDVYIVGEINGELVPGAYAGGDDIFVQRRTVNGDVVWTKQIGGYGNERGYGIDVAKDGTVYAIGSTDGYFPGFIRGTEDIVLIRITP
jgi:hypothetical protein